MECNILTIFTITNTSNNSRQLLETDKDVYNITELWRLKNGHLLLHNETFIAQNGHDEFFETRHKTHVPFSKKNKQSRMTNYYLEENFFFNNLSRKIK